MTPYAFGVRPSVQLGRIKLGQGAANRSVALSRGFRNGPGVHGVELAADARFRHEVSGSVLTRVIDTRTPVVRFFY